MILLLDKDNINAYFTGYMDEFRVSDYAPTLVAADPLYTGNTTGNFTPPTTPYGTATVRQQETLHLQHRPQ